VLVTPWKDWGDQHLEFQVWCIILKTQLSRWLWEQKWINTLMKNGFPNRIVNCFHIHRSLPQSFSIDYCVDCSICLLQMLELVEAMNCTQKIASPGESTDGHQSQDSPPNQGNWELWGLATSLIPLCQCQFQPVQASSIGSVRQCDTHPHHSAFCSELIPAPLCLLDLNSHY